MFKNYNYYQMNGYYRQHPEVHVPLFPVRQVEPQWSPSTGWGQALLWGLAPAPTSQVGQLAGLVLPQMGGAPAYGIGTLLQWAIPPYVYQGIIMLPGGVVSYPPSHPSIPIPMTPIHREIQ